MNENLFTSKAKISLPFPDSRLGNIALKVLSVDKDLRPNESTHLMTLVDNILTVEFFAINDRVLRVTINALLTHAKLCVDTLVAFDN